MADNPTTLFTPDDDEDVYRRLIDDMGNPPNGTWAMRQGQQLYTLLRPMVIEHKRVYDFAEYITSLGFLQFSQGGFLDAKAAEFGAIRKDPIKATLTMTFSGLEGTVVPTGTVVSTESRDDQFDGVTFITDQEVIIGVSGIAFVTATAETEGLTGNVGPGDVTLLITTVPGVTGVYNETPGTGGLDSEDDESLRQNALFRARSIPQSGNKATYSIIALDDPEVEAVYVEDFWDQSNGLGGNGTGRVIIGGGDTPYVSTAAVERLQEAIDPTVKNISHFENEIWSGGTEDSATPMEGQASRSLTATASATTTMTLTKTLRLGAFNNTTDDKVYVNLKRTTASGNLSGIKITFFVPGGTTVAKAEATIAAATINALTNITTEGLLKVALSSFTVTNGTGTFSWDNIAGMTLSLTSTGSGTSTLVFDGMRIVRGKGGFPDGQATLGVQVTVRSARAILVNIEANISLATGLVGADVQALIEQNIEAYLDSLSPGSIVRLTEIANAIHDVDGVVDYNTVEINGAASNLTLTADQRPIFGTFVGTVI